MLKGAQILVVEDEQSMREFLTILLQRHGCEVFVADGGQRGRELLDEREFDVVITDLKMPRVSGLDVLAHARKAAPATEVIMVTAFATAETAIQAMRDGAYDYLTKPFKVDEIIVTVERALEKRSLIRANAALRQEPQDRYQLERLIGRSQVMQRVFELVRKVAPSRSSVLISGESGTGKELVARAIHSLSDRSEGAFVPVNCGAIPDSLMESELFGHVRGSFTGATHDKRGLFVAADGGTLFLDEVGELGLQMQVKLLRALQERRIKPIGGVAEQSVDVRVLAATNRDLDEEVDAHRFRSDLFYRLNVIPLRLPPLRERRDDIPLLTDAFLRKFAAQSDRPVRGLTPDALALLCNYHYPGNVRVENLIERAVTLSSDTLIDASTLPEISKVSNAPVDAATLPDEGLDLDRYMGAIEQRMLLAAIERVGGNRTEAARILGISLRSLRYRLSKYGIEAGSD